MNKGLSFVIGLAVGAGIGATVGYFIGKKKANALKEEEIASVKEAYRKKYAAEPEPETPEVDIKKPILEKPPIEEVVKYTKIASQYSGNDEEKESSIRIINPVDFGLEDAYVQVSLCYTEDGYLLDEDDEPLDDPEVYLGMPVEEIPSHFGEYEDDSIYVMNDETQAYYEILLTNRRYEDEKVAPTE